ncbi:MAG: 50S ribosomal protein L23 [Saprospiraceae bacterium]|nr:50S ribosomal protein L23 [Saprospiraceae bacterium]
MDKQIIIKPVVSEKADKLSNKRGQYTFVVKRDCNKIEIQKAVEKAYSVNVVSVNTLVIPGKAVTRNTKTTVLKGRKPAYKKAIVTLATGETINIL